MDEVSLQLEAVHGPPRGLGANDSIPVIVRHRVELVQLAGRRHDVAGLHVALHVEALQLRQPAVQGRQQGSEGTFVQMHAADAAFERGGQASAAKAEALERGGMAEQEGAQVILGAADSLELQVGELAEGGAGRNSSNSKGNFS